jgi:hypothetical protein
MLLRRAIIVAIGSAIAAALAVLPVAVEPETGPVTLRIALALTIRNEDMRLALPPLRRLLDRLDRARVGDRMGAFILSDTQAPDLAAAEVEAVAAFRAADGAPARIRHRRRARNDGFKAGNVMDFPDHHDEGFDVAVMLDADSAMTAEAVLRLVRILHRPVPRTLPPAGAGDNTPILSHDQVEAAALGAAGRGVCVFVGEEGSAEANPPAMPEFLKRDARWLAGNLQYWHLLPLSPLAADGAVAVPASDSAVRGRAVLRGDAHSCRDLGRHERRGAVPGGSGRRARLHPTARCTPRAAARLGMAPPPPRRGRAGGAGARCQRR